MIDKKISSPNVEDETPKLETIDDFVNELVELEDDYHLETITVKFVKDFSKKKDPSPYGNIIYNILCNTIYSGSSIISF